MELEVMYPRNYRYIPPHKRQRTKNHEGGQIEEVLILIHYIVEEYDKVFT